MLPLRTSAPDWTEFTLNLDSAIAARGLSYGPDFKIRFNHYDDSSIGADGFAFDDIQVAEVITRGLALRLPPRGTEGDAPVTATLEAVPVPLSALSVALTNTHPGEIDIPGSVVIPAGSASITFPVTIIDDAVLDGTQNAVINAVAATYRTGDAVFPVDDNETAVLTLSLAPAAAEGGGALFGVVYVSAPVARDTPVTITSSHPAKLSPPAQTIIPAGETSASVPCNLPEDTVIDGTQSVTMTASVPNWTPGSAAVEISDNESSYLTLTLPLSVTEGLPPVNATLLASGTLTAPLTVTLAADDRLQLEVPASVTIPAGQSSVTIPVSAVDDSIADGSWAMGVLATAPGFGESGGSLLVHDNDALSFSVSTVGTTQTPGRTFAFTITALDAGQTPIGGFNSPIALRAADSSGTPVPVTPASIGVWNNGVWTGQVKVNAAGTGIVVTADDGDGHTGSTNPFDAIIGPLHHLTFSTIGPAQYYDAPFPLTIRAEDDAGNAVPEFNGTAVLAAVNSSGTVISLPFQPDAPVTFSAGIWSGAVSIPFLHDNLKLRASGTDAITGQSAVFSVTAPPAIVNSVVLSDSFDSTTPKDWWTFSGTSTWRTEITAQH